MMNPQPSTPEVQRYLQQFRCILHTMISDMQQAPFTGSISHNFIVQMIPHHCAAIQMSKNLLDYTDCQPLAGIASNIIRTQTQSIADMEQALSTCDCVQNSKQDLTLYHHAYRQITGTMFRCMSDAYTTCDLPANYIHEMIPHHLGAIRMSENAMQYPICAKLLPLLDDIIRSQREGIREMQSLLE